MSYVLQIWENPPDKPLPTSIAEAVQRVDALCEHDLTAPSPKFLALAERLLQRYPDFNTARPAEGEDEVDYHELAWSETLDGDGLDAVWGLGLQTGELFDKAKDLVFQEANALGLCVLDEQAGEAYLPGGMVLALPGQAASQPKAAKSNQPQENTPTTITVGNKVFNIEYISPFGKVQQASPRSKEVPPLAFEHLTPLMKAHGFTVNKGKRRFTRDLAESWCVLDIYTNTNHWPYCVKLRIRIGLYCQPIIDLFDKAENRPSLSREEILSPAQLYVNTDKWMEKIDDIEIVSWSGGGGYIIERYDQIERVLAELSRKFKTLVLPALEDVQTLADFDRHLNPPGDAPTSIFEFRPMGKAAERIAAAYLLHSPALEPLCEKFGNLGYDGKQWVAYVRSHPLEGGK